MNKDEEMPENLDIGFQASQPPKYIPESENNMMKMGFKKDSLESIHRIVCYVSSGFISVLKFYIQFTAPKFYIGDKHKICAVNVERKTSSSHQQQ